MPKWFQRQIKNLKASWRKDDELWDRMSNNVSVSLNNFKKDIQNRPVNKSAQRRINMVIKIILNCVITILAILFAYWEFGVELFSNKLFLLLFFAWVIFSAQSLLYDLRESKEKTCSDKIDDLSKEIKDLINEIREDRKQRQSGDKHEM